jgi:integrase
MPLTVPQIKNASLDGAPYKLTDGGGLYVLVTPAGGRLFRFDYRHAGKRKTMALGAFPDVTLADARQRRDKAKAALVDGIDPGETRATKITLGRAAKAKRGPTFEEVGRDWFAMRTANWASSYRGRILSRLEGDIYPVLGSRPINDIEAPDILAAIRAIEDRGAIELAKRVKNYCSEIFQFGIGEGRCKRNPAAEIGKALKKKPPTKHRAKIPAKEMPAFFKRLAQDQGDELTHLALRWTMLTMVRTQETRFALKREIEGDLWRIPAQRMKMRVEHLVPLSRQALALLPRIIELSGDSEYLFAMPGSKSGVISENRMLDCLYRMGYRGKATVHGFRGLASTVLNESTRMVDGDEVRRWHEDWIERQLAHVPEDEIRGTYNSAEWIGPRRRMLQWWADQLTTWEKDEEDEFEALLS